MKVFHFTNYYPNLHSIWGGAERACQQTVTLLKNKNVTNYIATLSHKQASQSNFFIIPTLEHFLPLLLKDICKNFKLLIFPFDFIAFISSFIFFKKIKPDIIHLHNFNLMSFAPLVAAKFLKIPTVLSIYDYWYFCPQEMLMKKDGTICHEFQGFRCLSCYEPGRFALIKKFSLFFRKHIFNFFLSFVDQFIVLSNASRKILLSYGIKDSKITILKQPVEVNLKKVDFSKIEEGLILFVGWKVKRKGLHLLLHAFKLIAKEMENVKLIAIGKNIDKEHLKSVNDYINNNGLSDKVKMFDKISQEELDSYWEKANVFVVPEQWENMSPLVVLEAMANGRAIVASNLGGIPEFIENGKTGFLAEYNNPRDFADKIVKLLKDISLVEKIGKAANEKIRDFCEPETFVNDQIKLYERIVNNAK